MTRAKIKNGNNTGTNDIDAHMTQGLRLYVDIRIWNKVSFPIEDLPWEITKQAAQDNGSTK